MLTKTMNLRINLHTKISSVRTSKDARTTTVTHKSSFAGTGLISHRGVQPCQSLQVGLKINLDPALAPPSFRLQLDCTDVQQSVAGGGLTRLQVSSSFNLHEALLEGHLSCRSHPPLTRGNESGNPESGNGTGLRRPAQPRCNSKGCSGACKVTQGCTASLVLFRNHESDDQYKRSFGPGAIPRAHNGVGSATKEVDSSTRYRSAFDLSSLDSTFPPGLLNFTRTSTAAVKAGRLVIRAVSIRDAKEIENACRTRNALLAVVEIHLANGSKAFLPHGVILETFDGVPLKSTKARDIRCLNGTLSSAASFSREDELTRQFQVKPKNTLGVGARAPQGPTGAGKSRRASLDSTRINFRDLSDNGIVSRFQGRPKVAGGGWDAKAKTRVNPIDKE